MDAQFTRYENLVRMCARYRGYTHIDEPLTRERFARAMNDDAFVHVKMRDRAGIDTHAYLYQSDCKHIVNVGHFKKQMAAHTKHTSHVILVSAYPPSSYIAKAIAGMWPDDPRSYFECLLHQHFNIEIPRGPLCYQHEVMNDDDVKRVLHDHLMAGRSNLPRIGLSDPQIIWIGARVGDVIRITSLSQHAGVEISYRTVVADVTRAREPEQKTHDGVEAANAVGVKRGGAAAAEGVEPNDTELAEYEAIAQADADLYYVDE